eukprot:ANDGO_00475.mRNA.1 hypothetical protein
MSQSTRSRVLPSMLKNPAPQPVKSRSVSKSTSSSTVDADLSLAVHDMSAIPATPSANAVSQALSHGKSTSAHRHSAAAETQGGSGGSSKRVLDLGSSENDIWTDDAPVRQPPAKKRAAATAPKPTTLEPRRTVLHIDSGDSDVEISDAVLTTSAKEVGVRSDGAVDKTCGTEQEKLSASAIMDDLMFSDVRDRVRRRFGSEAPSHSSGQSVGMAVRRHDSEGPREAFGEVQISDPLDLLDIMIPDLPAAVQSKRSSQLRRNAPQPESQLLVHDESAATPDDDRPANDKVGFDLPVSSSFVLTSGSAALLGPATSNPKSDHRSQNKRMVTVVDEDSVDVADMPPVSRLHQIQRVPSKQGNWRISFAENADGTKKRVSLRSFLDSF